MVDGALRIEPNTLTQFSNVKSIYYGAASDKKFVNLCNPFTYKYDLAEGQKINLDAKEATFEL